jgi:hypothetical protein
MARAESLEGFAGAFGAANRPDDLAAHLASSYGLRASKGHA